MNAPAVIARFAAPRRAEAGRCTGCGETVGAGDERCPQCRQLCPPGRVGMLAVRIDTPAGGRVVIAERTPAGGWAPIRTVAATGDTVRMLRRQDLASHRPRLGCAAAARPGRLDLAGASS